MSFVEGDTFRLGYREGAFLLFAFFLVFGGEANRACLQAPPRHMA